MKKWYLPYSILYMITTLYTIRCYIFWIR